jgi:hypothetical protein
MPTTTLDYVHRHGNTVVLTCVFCWGRGEDATASVRVVALDTNVMRAGVCRGGCFLSFLVAPKENVARENKSLVHNKWVRKRLL